MRLLLGFLPLLAATSAGGEPRDNVLERDVCIIGGGASGTYAAVRLADEGYPVAVIEKEDHLGGHTVTYTDPDTGTPLNMGVVVFHDTHVVRDYFGRLGVGLQDEVPWGGVSEYYDFSTGDAVPGYEPPDQETLGAALEKYGRIVGERYPNISLAYDLPDPVPEELVGPYGDFIENHGLEAIVKLVERLSNANGNLWERPALYGIKVLSPMLIEAFSRGFINAASGDIRDLFRAAEEVLGDDNVLRSSRVRKVKRTRRGVTVAVDGPEGRVTVKAKKLLVAIPPTTDILEATGIDLTTCESRLLGQFRGLLYGSAVLTHPGMDASVAPVNVGADIPYNLASLPGTYTYSTEPGTSKVKTYYGGTEDDVGMTEGEIKDLIRGELDNLQRKGVVGEGSAEFSFFANHSPLHVHVSPEVVSRGFYRELYELEGETNTFWTGATFVDHDSALIWAWSEEYLLPRIMESLSG